MDNLCVPKTSSGDDFGFRRQDSLFPRQNSLFLRNNSLFCCRRESLLQAFEFACVSAFKIAQSHRSTTFPVLFPVSRSGDGFDCDCIHHHPSVQVE